MPEPVRRRRFRPAPTATLTAAALLAAGLAGAADWPQWRGEARDGRSAERGLLARWPEGGPPLAWKAAGLGTGYSSLAVAAGRIYTMGDLADGQHVIAVAERDGSPIWKTRVGAIWDDEFPGPRATPTVDRDRLFAVTTEGDVVALALADGKELWRRSLPRDFGGALMAAKGSYNWKWAESPLVDGERVVVTPGGAAAVMVALDRKTGKELWRAKLPGPLGPAGADGAAYSSAVVSQGAGVRQYVQLVGRGAIGVEAASGRVLWSYNRVANDVAVIPTPLVAGDQVFVSTGYQTGAALLRLRKDGDGVRAEEVYFLPATTFQTHHGNMILHEGHVYAGHGHNRGNPIAVELATGKVAWGPAEPPGRASAAVTYADGRVYFRYQDGTMALVEASPKAYTLLGSFKIPDVKRESWSHPVVANGRLLLREQDALLAYELRPK
jgi:outer membrane protein assembly factor BamB